MKSNGKFIRVGLRKYGIYSLLLVLSCVLLLLTSCNKSNTNKIDTEKNSSQSLDNNESSQSMENVKQNQKVELNISAAASLRDVMESLEEVYLTKNPNVKINFNFASSGALQKQIEEGAEVDLFISAGKKQVDELKSKNLTKENSEIDLLGNHLVLIAPKDSEIEIKDLNDLLKDNIKLIAIGEESVPVGQYTRKVLNNLNIWTEVEKKANFAQDVRATLAWVEEKTVDLGFVYATDAAISDKVKVLMAINSKDLEPVIYPACLLNKSKHPEQATEFFDFIKSKEAKPIFEKFGFEFLLKD